MIYWIKWYLQKLFWNHELFWMKSTVLFFWTVALLDLVGDPGDTKTDWYLKGKTVLGYHLNYHASPFWIYLNLRTQRVCQFDSRPQSLILLTPSRHASHTPPSWSSMPSWPHHIDSSSHSFQQTVHQSTWQYPQYPWFFPSQWLSRAPATDCVPSCSSWWASSSTSQSVLHLIAASDWTSTWPQTGMSWAYWSLMSVKHRWCQLTKPLCLWLPVWSWSGSLDGRISGLPTNTYVKSPYS